MKVRTVLPTFQSEKCNTEYYGNHKIYNERRGKHFIYYKTYQLHNIEILIIVLEIPGTLNSKLFQ